MTDSIAAQRLAYQQEIIDHEREIRVIKAKWRLLQEECLHQPEKVSSGEDGWYCTSCGRLDKPPESKESKSAT